MTKRPVLTQRYPIGVHTPQVRPIIMQALLGRCAQRIALEKRHAVDAGRGKGVGRRWVDQRVRNVGQLVIAQINELQRQATQASWPSVDSRALETQAAQIGHAAEIWKLPKGLFSKLRTFSRVRPCNISMQRGVRLRALLVSSSLVKPFMGPTAAGIVVNRLSDMSSQRSEEKPERKLSQACCDRSMPAIFSEATWLKSADRSGR